MKISSHRNIFIQQRNPHSNPSCLKPEICSYARKHFRSPERVEFCTYVDVTACIPGDVIKHRDKLGNTPGVPEGGELSKSQKMTIFEQYYSMLKTGVCGEYRLHFCTWMNCLTCPLMSKACEIKVGITKGAL